MILQVPRSRILRQPEKQDPLLPTLFHKQVQCEQSEKCEVLCCEPVKIALLHNLQRILSGFLLEHSVPVGLDESTDSRPCLMVAFFERVCSDRFLEESFAYRFL